MVYFPSAGGLKTTETLLGIETLKKIMSFILMSGSQNYWNPFRDWNVFTHDMKCIYVGLKTTETLLGIETKSIKIALLLSF